MPKVILKVIKGTSEIEAPEFCPYKVTDIENKDIKSRVSSSICNICKFCTFVTELEKIEKVELSEGERERFIKYLTEINTKASSSLFAQKQYLTKNNRLSLFLLLSPSLSLQAFQFIFSPDVKKAKEYFSYYLYNELPICSIYGCPTYIARKLAKSQLQLVGEVSWK